MTDAVPASTRESSDATIAALVDSSGAHVATAQAIPDAQTATDGTQPPLMSTNEWARRRDSILTIVLWMLAVGMVFWLLSHVGRVILLLVISGLIAFALAPLTKVLSRVLPRPLAILLVYSAMLGALGGLGYLVVSTALSEGASLITQVHTFLSSGPHGAPSPLVAKLTEVGISQSQIDHLTSQLEGQAQTAVPLLGQFVNDTLSLVIDSVLVVVLSIYLLVDGARFGKWLRTTAPLKQRARVVFLLTSVQTRCGGLYSWPTHSLHPDRTRCWPGDGGVARAVCDPLGLTGFHPGVHSDGWHVDLWSQSVYWWRRPRVGSWRCWCWPISSSSMSWKATWSHHGYWGRRWDSTRPFRSSRWSLVRTCLVCGGRSSRPHWRGCSKYCLPPCGEAGASSILASFPTFLCQHSYR